MGEILGLGLTHYPPLIGLDENMAGILRTVLKDPGLPERYRDPASWPEAMQREYGDDGGTASASGAPREPGQSFPPCPQASRRLPAGGRRHLGRRPARELHRGRDPAVLRAGLRAGRGPPSRAGQSRPTSGAKARTRSSASTGTARPASIWRGDCWSRAWTCRTPTSRCTTRGSPTRSSTRCSTWTTTASAFRIRSSRSRSTATAGA